MQKLKEWKYLNPCRKMWKLSKIKANFAVKIWVWVKANDVVPALFFSFCSYLFYSCVVFEFFFCSHSVTDNSPSTSESRRVILCPFSHRISEIKLWSCKKNQPCIFCLQYEILVKFGSQRTATIFWGLLIQSVFKISRSSYVFDREYYT